MIRRCLLVLVLAALSVGASAEALEDGLAAFRARDYAKAFDVFDTLSKQGDKQATFYLSLLYGKGLGVEQNNSQSLYLLKQAAEGGNPMAQYNLGNQYNRQGAMGYDPHLAVAWWEKAAQQGLVLAQHNLGSLYALGRGVDQDLDRARYWYRVAADNGSEKSAEALKEIDRLSANSSKPGKIKGSGTRKQVNLVLVDKGWIDAQADNSFVLQMIATGERKGVEKLASRYQWKRPLLLYRMGAGDNAVWALAYGVFSNASSARQAISELPKKLRDGHPWPRALSDIKKRLLP